MTLLPTWLILAILTGLLSNTYNFLCRYILRDDEDPTAYAWFTEIVRLISFAIFAIFTWRLILTTQSVIALFFVGISEFIGGYFYFKMHSYTHLSISTILSRTRLIWVPLLAYLLIGETLKLPEYLGILVIFLGVSVIMAPKKLFIDKGSLYANLSAFFIAFNVVLLKIATPHASTAVIVAFESLPAVILYPLFMKNAKKRFATLTKTRLSLKLAAAGISVLQIYIFAYALNFGDASKINAVYQGMLVISVLAGIIFLGERKDIGKKLIGGAITVIGVLALSNS
jgi:drug/metabolite transporter (DMT)-like permease